ncbi:MAG: DUF2318 domain-containing protein [Desulfarculus sp.]|nr:MAG: DUF2318 domain-containing protein [Desulfarculus sp.]
MSAKQKDSSLKSKGIALDKKAQVLGQDGQTSGAGKGLLIAVLVVVLAGAAGLGYLWLRPAGGQAPAAANLSGDGQAVTLPAALFDDGKARHFKYDAPGGITVRYFVIKSSDGVIRAAFDACDVCWPENKGYFQEGDNMVCANCGRRFPSVQVNVVRGGCNPAPLNRSVVEGKVVLKVADILEGRRYFNFASKG